MCPICASHGHKIWDSQEDLGRRRFKVWWFCWNKSATVHYVDRTILMHGIGGGKVVKLVKLVLWAAEFPVKQSFSFDVDKSEHIRQIINREVLDGEIQNLNWIKLNLSILDGFLHWSHCSSFYQKFQRNLNLRRLLNQLNQKLNLGRQVNQILSEPFDAKHGKSLFLK